jgi:hypothetical protein
MLELKRYNLNLGLKQNGNDELDNMTEFLNTNAGQHGEMSRDELIKIVKRDHLELPYIQSQITGKNNKKSLLEKIRKFIGR